MWPWSRIRELEKALDSAQRDNRLLERRAEWFNHQWALTKTAFKREKERSTK